MEKIIEKVASLPAVLVDETITTTKNLEKALTENRPVKSAKRYWKLLGPGLTTGAADDDPAGVATYSQTGAQYGYQFLWLAALTFPLMSVVQEMCARIGLTTGRGLAANIRLFFPRWVLYLCTVLLLIANVLNVGANLGAMAKATQLVFPSTDFVLVLVGFTLFSMLLQIFTTYEKYAHYLKFLALILFSYVITAFTVQIDWNQVVKSTLVPTLEFTQDQIFILVAILGTTISPYLFFWQTSQEVEEEILEGKTTLAQRQEVHHNEFKNMRIDVWSGMFISNLVMFFIIAVCAATLNVQGIQVQTAEDAANALKPLAGEGAYLLFALGIIGTGLLAVPVLAGSAAYAIAESFRWKTGLYRKLKDAYAFYGVIIIAMIVGLLINFSGLDNVKALLYSAVLNGLVAPVILLLIVLLSSSAKVMGHHKNYFLTTLIGWFVVVLMTTAGAFSIYFFFTG